MLQNGRHGERWQSSWTKFGQQRQEWPLSHGLDVVDLEFIGPAKERTLRIYLEKNAEGRAQLKAAIAAGIEGLPERLVEGNLSVEQLSGITHEDCAAFSRDFGVLLDVEDLIPGAEYTLEASSPGLDRKLSRPEDFERFRGSLVKIQTFEPIRNNRHWQGRLVAGTDVEAGATVTLDLNAVKQNSKTEEDRRKHGRDCARQHRKGATGAGDLKKQGPGT